MRREHLPFAPPVLGDEEIAEVVDTLRSGWITTGPKAEALEGELARAVGAPAALAVSSGTAAMHVALCALGVGRGDVVVTSPMTFCSTVHVIEQAGATPVLVDVETDTLNIDPERVAAVLPRGRAAEGETVRALLPVHYGGHPCDMEPLLELAGRHDLAVVEDAAHALGASYRSEPVGVVAHERVARAVCFSFYATKNITTAEGGMVTAEPELVDEARVWSLHGMSRDAWGRYGEGGSWFYEVVRPGFKYNLSDVHAAIGLQQLRKLDRFQTRRREVARRYREGLAALDEIEVPQARADVTHAWHLYVIRLHLDRMAIGRDRFIAELYARNIGASVHFIPVHLHPYYRDRYGWRAEDLPIASREYERLVSLPIHPGLSEDDVDDVLEAITDVVHRHRRRSDASTQ